MSCPIPFGKDLDNEIADFKNPYMLLELYPLMDQVVVTTPRLTVETGEKCTVSLTDMDIPYSVTNPKLIVLKELYDPFVRHRLFAVH